MTLSLCRRLARTGMRTNRRLYIPYLLTCAGMIAMTYLISALSESAVLGAMSGGDIMQACLRLGFGVVTFFSAIFLFYTHSFLIRRRKKEFGLYNILGMGKKNLSLVLLLRWELCFFLHPERFYEQSNLNLSCAACREKLCHHKKQLMNLRLRKNWNSN